MPRWDRYLPKTLDEPLRRELARLVLEARPPEPAPARAGAVVEFRRGGQLACGYLARTPTAHEGYLVVDTEGCRRRLRRDKAVDLSHETVPTHPEDEGVQALRRIDAQREAARRAVDLDTLWRVALDPGDRSAAWSLQELLALHDAADAAVTRRVGLLRALWRGDRFERVEGGWRPRCPEAVHQLRQTERAQQGADLRLAELAAWLRRVADGGPVEPRPQDAPLALRLLAEAALGGEPAPQAARLMQAAHLHGPGAACDTLVRLGHWSPDESLELHRLRVPDAFDARVEEAARRLAAAAAAAAWPGRRRWGGGVWAAPAGDRAYRVRRRLFGQCVVDIHVAVPALLIPPGGAVDAEAALRGTAVDLIERRIPLLPEAIAAASRFTTEAARPALTVTVRLSRDLEPIGVRLAASRVRPHARLGADGEGRGAAVRRLAALALALRRRRRAAGAWEALGPMPWIGVGDGRPGPRREQTAERIDTELRLLAAAALARLCQERGVPAIYATREAPTAGDLDPIGCGAGTGADVEALRSYRLEGRAPRAVLSCGPGAHAGLGVAGWALGARPLDSYVDLVMQRQLLAAAGLGEGRLSPAQLDRILLETKAAHEAAARVERSSQRYWCLKWLEATGADERLSVVVVEPRGPGCLVLLEGGPAPAYLPPAGNERLETHPGRRLTARVAHVSARRNRLHLTDPQPA